MPNLKFNRTKINWNHEPRSIEDDNGGYKRAVNWRHFCIILSEDNKTSWVSSTAWGYRAKSLSVNVAASFIFFLFSCVRHTLQRASWLTQTPFVIAAATRPGYLKLCGVSTCGEIPLEHVASPGQLKWVVTDVTGFIQTSFHNGFQAWSSITKYGPEMSKHLLSMLGK